jgi:S1-C subfamily serine protease
MTRCPKCSHDQDNQEVCEACGLIFRKFEELQERRREQADTRGSMEPEDSGAMVRVALVALLVMTVAVLAYYFAAGRGKEQEANSRPSAVSGQAGEGDAPASVEAPVDASRELAVIPGTPIDYARNGTVSIEAPWGKGSGFFITGSDIVTNKHVVAPDQSQLNEFRHKVETGRKLIALEKEKIAELRSRMNSMEDGPSRSQLFIIIQEKERDLAKVLPLQEEAEARLRPMEQQGSQGDINVILSDGTVLPVQSVQTSSGRDLALLTVFPTKPTVLRAAPANAVLRQGDRVYTIGNPVGLRNTVTSGVFSGYRQMEASKDVMLQTDAPINPGNSGGPLIDERGFVHGVNTMIIRDTQGIGFAIPIQTVMEEFSIQQRP